MWFLLTLDILMQIASVAKVTLQNYLDYNSTVGNIRGTFKKKASLQIVHSSSENSVDYVKIENKVSSYLP